MIKHILSAAIITIALSINAGAQCTIDNSYTSSGYYPSSLSDATVNVAYDQTVQVVIPKDTLMFNVKWTISKVYIDSVTGLPSGITSSCNPSNCTFPGNSNNCIELIGTPTTTGSYPIKVYYRTVITGAGTFPGTITQYTLTVNNVTNIDAITNNPASLAFTNIMVLGNNNKNEVQFYSANPSTLSFEVYNMLGNLMFNKKIEAKAGINSTDVSLANLRQGIYILCLSNGNQKISRRVVIN